MSDENSVEKDWDYMERAAPWAYKAFHRIPRLGEAMGALFDTPSTKWEGDDAVDLTNKTLFALLQIEIEAMQESLEGLQPRKGWRLLIRAKDKILFQSPLGEVAEVPVEIADVLMNGTFEGDVTAHGKYLRFSVGEDVLADIPRSLVLELRESRPQAKGVEGAGGTGRTGREGGDAA